MRASASSMPGTWVVPRKVEWSSFASCSARAALTWGWQWPIVVVHREETPSRWRRPSTSISQGPSARSTTVGSSSTQWACWVNGCQTAAASRAIQAAAFRAGPVAGLSALMTIADSSPVGFLQIYLEDGYEPQHNRIDTRGLFRPAAPSATPSDITEAMTGCFFTSLGA